MVRALFVCVENANRSQMAEAFARMHGQGVLEPDIERRVVELVERIRSDDR